MCCLQTGWFGEAGLVDIMADTAGKGMIRWLEITNSNSILKY
jgi:hypothetical protein